MDIEMQKWRDSLRTAADASNALREALAALGIPPEVCDGIRPMVGRRQGHAYVSLPDIKAEHIERIAEAVRISPSVRS
ncbi:hypothetical protein ACFWY6_09345 [Streptomyces sp. NPDC059037]|uniref:hypothetical protein n=1 Tax=Streptomyces sp. NPDC059037 TaxID=3346710 RepID=UPI0036AFA9EC